MKFTPKEIMKLFLTRKDYFDKVGKSMSDKHQIPLREVMEELIKFKEYWSELNGSGKKQRWELQKTFELKKRLITWFKNVKKYSFKKEISERDMIYLKSFGETEEKIREKYL